VDVFRIGSRPGRSVCIRRDIFVGALAFAVRTIALHDAIAVAGQVWSFVADAGNRFVVHKEAKGTTMPRSRDREADWLRSIAEHPETTDADYAVAEEILHDPQLTYEQRNSVEVKRLEDLQYLFVNPGGTWEPAFGST
jgi:hypothetical protein